MHRQTRGVERREDRIKTRKSGESRQPDTRGHLVRWGRHLYEEAKARREDFRGTVSFPVFCWHLQSLLLSFLFSLLIYVPSFSYWFVYISFLYVWEGIEAQPSRCVQSLLLYICFMFIFLAISLSIFHFYIFGKLLKNSQGGAYRGMTLNLKF